MRAGLSGQLGGEWASVPALCPRSRPRTRGQAQRGSASAVRAALPKRFPARGAARGQRRFVPRDTPGGAAPSGLGAAPPRFALAPVTKVQGQERRAAKPRLAQALFFARAAGTPRSADPAREWPPSEALCVSARPAGPARDVPARPAAPPRQRPSPMLISLAARLGGRPAAGSPLRLLPGPLPEDPPAARSPRTPSCQMPSTALLLHALCQETSGLPGVPRPRGKGRPTTGGAPGLGAEGA